ncbi:MAG: magnesium transporter [Woeseia sp.]|nr:magnesium transporter [Woeseia sp.]MBT8095967.1 magnesium transporter [Woeseia sp.]NNE60529.1 magnesium transporter [Woeseia sp.]NNL55279.1 magnesium transporter [Woeseia sp.]
MTLELTLKETYLREQPADAARSLETISDRKLSKQLAGIQPAAIVASLELLTDSRASAVFRQLDLQQQQGILHAASPRLALTLLAGMRDEKRQQLFETLPEAVRKDLERLQQFADDSAGRLLDRPYDTIRSDMTVEEALKVLRRSGTRRARSLYVVDRENKLVGKVDMQAMAMAYEDEVLSELLEDLEGTVLATAPRKEIVEQLEKYRVDSLPVVDVEGRLLGVVRYQRLFDAIESVATASLQKMVGVSADERALSTATFAVKRRLPWLHINLLTAFLAAAVVGVFESLIAQFTALAVLLPVVAGQSGNAGSQALAVTMRGLALREIGTREWRRVLVKEVKIGLLDGLALAVTCGLSVYVWSQSLGLALVIAVAMVMSMVAAGISGAVVPIMLTRLGQDPATASSIILTTVTDVAGFISFLGTASLLSFML